MHKYKKAVKLFEKKWLQSKQRKKEQQGCSMLNMEKLFLSTPSKIAPKKFALVHMSKNTCELGHFKIKKEESSSSGVRRIKAVLE